MIRLAAVGDVHVGADSAGLLREHLASVSDRADALLLAGDLTKAGEPEEAVVLSAELEGLGIPVVAVLGNHDHHGDRSDVIAKVLRDIGVIVLEGDAIEVDTPGGPFGVAGVKGFGGGFAGANGTEFGEPEMKAFIRHSKERADALESALASLSAPVKVALMHYSPVRDTLQGEPPEIFPFLGSYLLAEAIDRAGADLAVHGHAHRGVEHGLTPGGVNVRNVAQSVIRRGYAIYTFGEEGERSAVPTGASAQHARP